MVSRMLTDRSPDSDVSLASTYSIRDHEISVPGGTIVVRAIIPTAPDGTDFPVLVYLHGGGAQYPSICVVTLETTVCKLIKRHSVFMFVEWGNRMKTHREVKVSFRVTLAHTDRPVDVSQGWSTGRKR